MKMKKRPGKAAWRALAGLAAAVAICALGGCGTPGGTGDLEPMRDMGDSACTFDNPEATFDNCRFA